MDRPNLSGKLILVPSGRVGVNVLARLLERAGAEVVTFPTLRGAPPSDLEPLTTAVRCIDRYDWVVFSGELAVIGFFECLEAVAPGASLPASVRVGAIGVGAVSELRRRGVTVDYAPRDHTAAEVVAGLGKVRDRQVLLVRPEGAGAELREELRRAGARVTEVAGFRVIVDATAPEAVDLPALRPHLVAFGNPTAVRLFAAGTDALGIDALAWLRGIRVAAVGHATAEEARRRGIEPDLVSAGRLKDLVRDLGRRGQE